MKRLLLFLSVLPLIAFAQSSPGGYVQPDEFERYCLEFPGDLACQAYDHAVAKIDDRGHVLQFVDSDGAPIGPFVDDRLAIGTPNGIVELVDPTTAALDAFDANSQPHLWSNQGGRNLYGRPLWFASARRRLGQ